jgi:hypothetical protein
MRNNSDNDKIDDEENEDQNDDASDEELELTFTGVLVYRGSHIIVSSVVDAYAEERRDHALVYHFMDGEWLQQLVDNSLAGICVVEEPGPKVLSVGVDGEVDVATLPGFSKEQVDPSDRGPSYSVLLRCVRVIGGRAYAAGMARLFYRREAQGRWVSQDQGLFMPRGKRTRALGIMSIDGTAQGDIYAVGYKGQIWHYDGDAWLQEDSPTNVLLSGVRCASKREVYVCGMAGTILRGTAGQWRALEQDLTTEDFWGIALFKKRVYFANHEGVFRLDGDELTKIDVGTGVSTAYLDANKDIMWSVGHKDILSTSDGIRWAVVEKP